jgi:hypothetical protein
MSTSVSPLGQTNNSGAQIITLVAPAPAAVINYTLSVAQSGSTVLVPSNGVNAVTITLPPVANAVGCTFRIIMKGAVQTGTVIVTTGAGTDATIVGNSIINATPTVQATAGNTITFINTVAASSNIELFSDGINYNYRALSNSALNNAITNTTVAAPAP